MLEISLNISFWLLALLTGYSYFLYPIVLMLLPARTGRSSPPPSESAQTYQTLPAVSVIVTAHDEEARIRSKLDNLLSLPPYGGKLEIIVASDASMDGTDRIVAEFADRGVRLVRNDSHDGKEAAQRKAIANANGDILVFSDVATEMKGDVLERISKHFADPTVGAISSTDRFIDRDGNTSGEGAYVRYEMFVRRLESKVGSLVGLSGSFCSVRSEICRKHWAVDIPSDFMAAINCVRSGQRAAAADDVFGYYQDLKNPSQEYRRKVRTVLRGMQAIAKTPGILNLKTYGLFAFQIWSHKIMRWLTPWFLLPLLLVNIAVVPQHVIYEISLALQLLLYALVAIGVIWQQARNCQVVRIPYFFFMANLAVMHAALDLVRGRSIVAWVPSER